MPQKRSALSRVEQREGEEEHATASLELVSRFAVIVSAPERQRGGQKIEGKREMIVSLRERKSRVGRRQESERSIPWQMDSVEEFWVSTEEMFEKRTVMRKWERERTKERAIVVVHRGDG